MNIKIAALGLILAIATISLNFIFFRNQADIEKFETTYQKNAPTDNQKSAKELKISNPLDWVRPIENFIAEKPAMKEENPVIIENNFNKNQKDKDILSLNSLFESMKMIIGVDNTENNIEFAVEYYKKFLGIARDVNFNQEEFILAKKDDDGRIFSLEELIGLANSGTPLVELKNSFKNWRTLDEKILTELKNLPDGLKTNQINQMMADWFEYHLSVAKKFSEENLSQSQISQTENEFRKKAEIHNKNFRKSVAVLEKSREFAFVKKADAFTCGAISPPGFYNFGGKVAVMAPCNWGIVETISPPCGGLFLFSYPVLAANPFLYKKPTIGSSVFGKSAVTPGACMLGACPGCVFFPYEATVLYFGTTLSP